MKRHLGLFLGVISLALIVGFTIPFPAGSHRDSDSSGDTYSEDEIRTLDRAVQNMDAANTVSSDETVRENRANAGNEVQLESETEKSSEIEATIDEIYAGMNVEERLSQLLLLGWPGSTPSERIMRWIDRGLGGVKIFGWNGRNTFRLAGAIAEMQEAALNRDAGHEEPLPLFTVTDQEGGWVRHVRGNTSRSPGNMALGATGIPADTYDTGKHLAREMRAVGVNVNLAPVVDVYRNTGAAVIGPRAFGDDPARIGLLGLAYLKGQEEVGVISAAKHFPGHGNTDGDSHIFLPELPETREELEYIDLVPFRMMIREGVPAVLSGHLAFPEITGSNTPASLSYQIMTDLLRDELGFEGIVITDDMHMRGATAYADRRGWSFAELLVRAIEAGNDLIMLSQTPDPDGKLWETLVDAYEHRPGFSDRVEEAVKRNLRVKLQYLGDNTDFPRVPDTEALSQSLPSPGATDFFEDLARRAVSVVRSERIPLDLGDELPPDAAGDPSAASSAASSAGPSAEPETGKVLLTGNVGTFFDAAETVFPDAAQFRFPYSPSDRSRPEDRMEVVEHAQEADLIVFGLSNRSSLEVLQELEEYAERIVVISTFSPLLLEEAPFVEDAIAVYSTMQSSFEAGFEVLKGEREPQGTVPLRGLTQR